MNEYKVIFEVFNESGNGKKSVVPVIVEAGTKKLAALRAMKMIDMKPEFTGLWKTVKSIEKVMA